jgi:hypothetical protein
VLLLLLLLMMTMAYPPLPPHTVGPFGFRFEAKSHIYPV